MDNSSSSSRSPAIGDRFGIRVVVGPAPPRRGRQYVRLRCDCGSEIEMQPSRLKIGGRNRCPQCYYATRRVGGVSYSPEWRAWQNMLKRCRNPKYTQYRDYGGRGIIVCAEWHSFHSFYKDMGPKPSPEHTLDRIDNSGNYEPSNCRWATHKEQQRNTRRNRLLTYNNETHCISDWAAITGLKRSTLRGRLEDGWSVKDALTTPTNTVKRYKQRS